MSRCDDLICTGLHSTEEAYVIDGVIIDIYTMALSTTKNYRPVEVHVIFFSINTNKRPYFLRIRRD